MSVEANTVKPYQQVDGLKEIFVSLDRTFNLSFVFDSAEKAEKARQATLIQYRAGKVDADRGTNLSKIEDSLVVCYSGGDKIKSAQELLKQIGTAMAAACPSKEINAVPIHGVVRD